MKQVIPQEFTQGCFQDLTRIGGIRVNSERKENKG